MRAEHFFEFARKRHQIYLDRQAGLPRPWTDDPILQLYRFTNVFRELDRTTLWFRANVRQYLLHADEEGQLLGTILFRTLNRTETAEVIFNQNRLGPLRPAGWAYLEGEIGIEELEQYMRAHCPAPWVTGAYIVKTPDGMDKLRGALWIVEEARKRAASTVAPGRVARSLQAFHEELVGYPYLGGFTAYEIVSDLRHLPILKKAEDIMTWAHAGPGAIRGLNRITYRETRAGMPQGRALGLMQDLLACSKLSEYWPSEWPVWEMREVEHTLCEFDKYERVRLREGTPRGRFT